MSRVILELNDSNITVANAKDILAQSPGYAIVHDDSIQLGETARDSSFLYPQRAFNRFWCDLNQIKLKTSSRLARHNADLAFAHLGHIHELAGKPAEMVLAVPGSYSNDHLALLAGLVDASPFSAPALVDAALAAAASEPHEGISHHLDVTLHQAILTTLETTHTVKKVDTRVIDDAGLMNIYNKCANFIADLFVEQSRFDPLHHAETEQVLYNQLPRCLESLTTQSEVLLEITFENNKHQAKLKRDPLVATLQAAYGKLSGEIIASDYYLLSDRVSRLPGLVELFPESRVLTRQSVINGCMLFPLASSTDSSISFITEIQPNPAQVPTQQPVTATKTETAVTEQVTSETTTLNKVPVSHLLIHGTAYPLHSTPLYLSAASPYLTPAHNGIDCDFRMVSQQAVISSNSSSGVLLNNQPIADEQILSVGDLITSQSQNLTLQAICVLPENDKA